MKLREIPEYNSTFRESRQFKILMCSEYLNELYNRVRKMISFGDSNLSSSFYLVEFRIGLLRFINFLELPSPRQQNRKAPERIPMK